MQQTSEREQIIINANYVFFIAAITLLSVINSLLIFLLNHPEARRVVLIVNTGISALLLLDFLVFLLRARQKRTYLIRFHGWMAFLGSLPVPFMGLFRLLRSWLVVRKFRRTDFDEAKRFVLDRRAGSTLLFFSGFAIVIFELAGVLIISIEQGAPYANITTAGDALWWAIVTVATVGYGDYYPVSSGGRFVAVLLMVAGIGLFSVLTSYLADWFRGPRQPKGQVEWPAGQLDAPAAVDEIRRLLEQQEADHQRSLAELQAKLADLEQLVSR